MDIPTTKDGFYTVAVSRLNSKEKEAVLKIGKSIKGLSDDAVSAFELEIVQQYQKMDKARVYQLFVANKPFSSVRKKAVSLKDKFRFLKSPKFNDWSSVLWEENDNSVRFNFSAFQKISVPAFTPEGLRIPGETKTEAVLYLFELHIEPLDKNRTAFFIKFPPIQKEVNRVYNYKSETEYVLDWVYSKLSISLIPIKLKKFYEDLDRTPKIDRRGFRTKELKGAAGKRKIDAIFSITLEKSVVSSKTYQQIDEVLLPLLWDKFEESLGRNFPDLKKSGLNRVNLALKDMNFSEEYFRLVHQVCLYGRGFITYSSGEENLRYTLEYEKNRYGLIRVDKQGWDCFEPIYKKLVSYV